MKLTKSFLTAAAMVALSTFGLAACTPAAASVVVEPDTIIIDVRTPEEFQTGHLEGAQLLDINGGELQSALPSLDPEAEYLVYCRSGNRSGQAVALMKEAGFTSVTNIGSVEQASRTTGIPITLR